MAKWEGGKSPSQQRRLDRIPVDKRDELKSGISSLGRLTADLTPGVGDVMSAKEAYDAYAKGDYGTAALLAALTGVGLFPVGGDVASTMGKKALNLADEVPGNWLHGTKGDDFNEFKSPVFLTQDPDFANTFALRNFSAGDNAKYGAPPAVTTLEKAIKAAPEAAPTGARVVPVRPFAKNLLDFANPEHIALMERYLPYDGGETARKISKGDWKAIESNTPLLKMMGFDGAYIQEEGRKNLMVFSPQQAKSKLSAPSKPDLTSKDMSKAKGGAIEMPSEYSQGRWKLI
jgi:hypothetical protein